MVIYLSLILVTLLSLYLRIVNISPFKFYPDSYQNLIVAENIKTFHSVLGFLGDGGMVYPYFVMWTRPVYPILINLANIFLPKVDIAAQFVSTFASVLSIVVTYLFIYSIFQSKKAGIIASLLLGISFNHTVWSGFIYSESTGILFNLIFLTLLVKFINIKSQFLEIKDLIVGVFFSLAVFSRYEYIVFLMPVLVLILIKSPKPIIKTINFLIGFLLTTGIFLSQLFPVKQFFTASIYQMEKLIKLAAILGGGFLAGGLLYILFKQKLKLNFNTKKISYLLENVNLMVLFLILQLVILILIQIFLGERVLFYQQFSSLRRFVETDFLIGILYLFGISLILLQKKYLTYGYFSLASIFIIWPIYNLINPLMVRYWTHLLPFFLIPSTYFLIWFFDRHKKNILTLGTSTLCFLVLLVLQLSSTYSGIKGWGGGWFKESYEQKSAKILSSKLTPDSSNKILLASFPEPYYFFTRIPTQSILVNDSYPFINIPNEFNETTLYIIDDMGMKDIFPNFSKFINKNLQDKKLDEYWVGEKYHYTISVKDETSPVTIYQIKTEELKNRI